MDSDVGMPCATPDERGPPPVPEPQAEQQETDSSQDNADLASSKEENDSVGFPLPDIDLYEDQWSGDIEEIERPPSGFEEFQNARLNPLHALSVIKDMIEQFSAGQEFANVPFYVRDDRPSAYIGPCSMVFPGPYGVPPPQAMRARPHCPFHGASMYAPSVNYMNEIPSCGRGPMYQAAERQYFQKPDYDSTIMPTNPVEIEVMQKHLLALLHAHGCLNKEAAPAGHHYRFCNLPYCKTTKKLIRHMKNCNSVVGCTFPLCEKSWNLIRHYGKCVNDLCLICKPFVKPHHEHHHHVRPM